MDMCPGMLTSICMDMCAGMRIDMRIEMNVDMPQSRLPCDSLGSCRRDGRKRIRKYWQDVKERKKNKYWLHLASMLLDDGRVCIDMRADMRGDMCTDTRTDM